jgi:hypothetical protein
MASPVPEGSVEVATRAELEHVSEWREAFADLRKDHRYYELLEDTIPDFEYRYFVMRDAQGGVLAIQPFLLSTRIFWPAPAQEPGRSLNSCGGPGRAFCSSAR